jgi:hypothetical protein
LEIGESTKDKYPELNTGDIVIVHHSVEAEAQDFRLVDIVLNSANTPIYEHRILNAFFEGNNEIFGKIETKISTDGTTSFKKIIPLSGHHFCKSRFNIMYDFSQRMTPLFEMRHDYSKCHTLTEFVYAKENLSQEFKQKREALLSGYQFDLKNVRPYEPENPYTQSEIDKISRLNTKIQEANMESEKASKYVNKNFVVKLKNHNDDSEHFLVPLLYCYPINLFGKDYIKVHEDMIIAKQHKNIMKNQWRPIGSTVFVAPIQEEKTSLLEMPTDSITPTKTGIITHIGDEVAGLSVGETVTYLNVPSVIPVFLDEQELIAIPKSIIKTAK